MPAVEVEVRVGVVLGPELMEVARDTRDELMVQGGVDIMVEDRTIVEDIEATDGELLSRLALASARGMEPMPILVGDILRMGIRPSAVVSSNAALPAGGGGAFVTQGEAAFRSGDYAKAVYAFRHAAVDDPQNAMTVLLLGHALFATGQFEEAAGTTQAALENLPRENWGAVIKRYRELYGKPQDYTAQLRTLERAIQNKPEDPALRFLAGYHYSYLGFTKQAIDQFDRVLKLAPQDEIARQLRNKMQEKIGTPVTPGPAAIPVSKEGPALPGTADAE